MTESLTAYLGLGSNLGDRLQYLQEARSRLAALPGVVVSASSCLYQSEALGGPPGQPPYLNAVVVVQTALGPVALLDGCKVIELQLGRQRIERWGARTLDIDLLLFGTLQIDSDLLSVPHPRMLERSFVLLPLAELAPTLVHPVAGLSITQLAQKFEADPHITSLGAW